jgi:hypothetical protein
MLERFYEKSKADLRGGIPSLYKQRTWKGKNPYRGKKQRGFSKYPG